MKNSIKLLVVIVLIAFTLVSCNWPYKVTQEPNVQVTPNLTLTALFDTSKNIPPTITPPAIVTEAPVLPTVAIPTVALPTVAPTATLVPPVPTAAPRVRWQMQAKNIADAPPMDGTYETWVDKTTKYKLPFVVWGASNWTGQADLEGAYAAVWDYTYLYIAVKITDDKYVQKLSGDSMYKGDGVELLIDTKLSADYYNQYLDNDDFQIGLSAGNSGLGLAPEAYQWYPSGSKGTKSQITLATIFESDTIYRIEARIPWSYLGVTPTPGMKLGFAVSINDNDNTSSNVQQTMISTAQFRNFLDPTSWDEIVLAK
jgi:hypothetical protein